MSTDDLGAILADPNAPVWLYIDTRSTQRGPVSENDIKWLIAADQINTQTYGWCPGLSEWVKMSEHPTLMQHFLTLSALEEPWFYMDSNMCKTGPVDTDLIIQLYKASQLHEETLVWTTGQTSTSITSCLLFIPIHTFMRSLPMFCMLLSMFVVTSYVLST